jgi:hypothetical protein
VPWLKNALSPSASFDGCLLEQEQPDGKAVTSSTSEVVSEITLNPEVMQIPPAPEESGYQNVAALVGSSATLP